MTLYCPSCRVSFPHPDSKPPYSAIHKYAEAPSNGDGPPPKDAPSIHLHPITREEVR